MGFGRDFISSSYVIAHVIAKSPPNLSAPTTGTGSGRWGTILPMRRVVVYICAFVSTDIDIE